MRCCDRCGMDIDESIDNCVTCISLYWEELPCAKLLFPITEGRGRGIDPNRRNSLVPTVDSDDFDYYPPARIYAEID